MAIKDLFAQHPGHFYYLSLITSGGATRPAFSAWSEEAHKEADKRGSRWDLKWSYAESPFFCFGDEYFGQVKDLFATRLDINSMDEGAHEAEYELRLRAMETAILRLDRKGVFGVGADRLDIIVNVEVMPPDFTNTLRAMRLNPPEAIQTWLEEAAERE